tara:strand:+ start:498 stop:626 length:129 start_codon:yes stop_codon:yes gene_type:complete
MFSRRQFITSASAANIFKMNSIALGQEQDWFMPDESAPHERT